MQITSFNDDLIFGEKITTKIILESSFSKEIRILLKQGQVMKEHKTKFPIVVQVLKGEIDFGVNNTTQNMQDGGIISLEGGVPHDLKAKKDSVIRLTLSKFDNIERLQDVIKQSS